MKEERQMVRWYRYRCRRCQSVNELTRFVPGESACCIWGGCNGPMTYLGWEDRERR